MKKTGLLLVSMLAITTLSACAKTETTNETVVSNDSAATLDAGNLSEETGGNFADLNASDEALGNDNGEANVSNGL